MTINFEKNNDVIVYVLETIISYARYNQYIFVAQSVWWLAYSIVLQEGLVTYIDKLRLQSEIYHTTRKPISDQDNQSCYDKQDASKSKTELQSTSKDFLNDRILEKSEEFLRISERDRKMITRKNLHSSKKLLGNLVQQSGRFKQKPRKSYKDQTQGIETSELD